MNLAMPQDKLVQSVRIFSRSCLEHNQVAARLKKLLPNRLRSLKADHRSGQSAANAERHALSDSKYITFLDEYLAVHQEAMRARVEYETHLMLIEARRSLRALRSAGLY